MKKNIYTSAAKTNRKCLDTILSFFTYFFSFLNVLICVHILTRGWDLEIKSKDEVDKYMEESQRWEYHDDEFVMSQFIKPSIQKKKRNA